MSRTIGQVKTKITSGLHGTTLNKISDFYGLCEDAAELMLARIDPLETTRRASLVNAVYDNVNEYSLPVDFKSPADLEPQANTGNNNNSSLSRTFGREFKSRKKNNTFAIAWREAVQFLRFRRSIRTPATIDKADSLTENGTWAVGGNASNLELDTFNYVAGIGSLSASVSSPGAVTNVSLRIGNNNTSYYTITVTAGHFEAFQNNWNLLRFNLLGATLTGSVDTTDMDYVRVTVNYNSGQSAYFEKTLTNGVDLSQNYMTAGAVFLYFFFDSITSLTLVRLDNIVAALGTLYDIEYYSNYLFRSAAGSWKGKPTIDTDLVNLSPTSYKIFEAEISRIITQQVEGAMGVFDFTYWDNHLEDEETGLYAQYATQFPSERFDAQTSYHDATSNTDMGYYPDIDGDETEVL